ncbi:uncharacterized protein CTRU02_202941 [Colletotrichum truncatum]|uniref:Uncharacterized protein n=1 Tax=Colletotrichum truncatum TaxID=5467 RepID=A0ACC3Z7X6_COLTU|nr:uncharacterized protein CTRU02_13238 [Colletotrichum truncatum]KAF6783730.1 hypothetical protein CTRU02_13238 [Colletotrichum truncatum]
MRLFSSLLALIHISPLVVLAQGDVADEKRRLPADLQVDLLFPRDNETYAPTQWFPIVLGVQNIDALMPLDIVIDLSVVSLESWQKSSSGSRAEWQHVDLRLNSLTLPDALGPTPGKLLLHYPAVNMTNGTTDQFAVRWGFSFANRCFANNSDPSLDDGGEGWSSGYNGSSTRNIVFRTAPGGQTPDIAAAVDACPEGRENTTSVIRVTDVRKTRGTGYQCPVFETDVQPTRCAYRDLAQELAANVSTAILDKMGCENGTWQTITAPCAPKKSGSNSLNGVHKGMGSWSLALGVALVMYHHVL